MNLRRSKTARAVASVAAFAMLLGPSAAWAQEESPAPEESPEATPTDAEAAEEEAAHDAKHHPTTLEENVFSLGQSMQLRVNADGEQNAKALNFRWTVSQLNIQGPPDGSKDGEYVVPVPEGGALPRYLENFGFIHVENGYGEWDMNVQDGWDTQRSVSLFPQDAEPKVSLKTEFTLDGEVVKAQDIVGKSGLVTANYTIINNTTKPYDVVVKNLAGEDVTVTADGDSPMVAITKTLLPQRFTGLNTGAGLYGADGRGNNQVQWISLPFKPISEDSTASFGWAAYVTNGVIPSLLMQISPLYIPAHDPEAEPAEEEAASASNPIPLDPAIAQIQAGLASVVSGLDSIHNTAPADEPCAYNDPATGAPYQDPLQCLSAGLNNVIGSIFGVVTGSVQDLLAPCSDTVGPESSLTCALTTVAEKLGQAGTGTVIDADQWGKLKTFASIMAPVGIGATNSGCGVLAAAGLVAEQSCIDKALALSDALTDSYEDFLAAGTDISAIADVIAPIVEDLTAIYNTLAGFESSVNLGTVAEVVAGIKADLLGRGGDQVVAGLDQASAGVAQAKGIIGAYVADLSVQVQAVIADVQAGVISADEALVHLRGNIGALKAAAAESPLIYGPLPPGTPENTILFAAYEFRIDAADTNHPYTLPRILVGLIALIGAGFLAKFASNRNKSEDDYAAMT